MTVRTLDGKSLCEQLAENYKRTLPKNGTGVKWTMDSFSTYINLRYPKIKVNQDQEWTRAQAKYTFTCEDHGDYTSWGHTIVKEGDEYGCGCKGCDAESKMNRRGKHRKPRATSEEKAEARRLHIEEGWSYRQIGLHLGRSTTSVRYWINPDVAAKDNLKHKDWVEANAEHALSVARDYYKTDHGYSAYIRKNGVRRGMERNVPESVFLDNEWCEVDRRETYRVFGEVLLPSDEREAIQDMYLEAQQLTEKSGVEFHVDHIHPLSKGGEHMEINLQIIPAEENLSKKDKFSLADQAELCKRLFNIK
jgi:hypothetical protein